MKRLPSWTAPAAVAAAATAAFLPALLNGFVSWDDGLYLTDNPGVRGLTADNVRWAFTSVRGGSGSR
ncbi:MAG: hypothetical protein M0D55_15525 [Elusimicrobiota bacterium]|nr:MAG: hypothetical protein M0D55_15525 [Elusimicrobiota bacterium]